MAEQEPSTRRDPQLESPAETFDLELGAGDRPVGVTRFFRDGQVWEALASRVLPSLVEGKRGAGELRLWVPGCSTGEEAYSLAIVLTEILGRGGAGCPVRIFATDLDCSSIARARRGLFPDRIARDVSPQRLQRFFIHRDGEYQISRHIRDSIVFAAHDVSRDAPFSRVDLVSCRNVLLYLDPAQQRHTLRLLHYGLLPSGYLLLGPSETTTQLPDHFAAIDGALRLYAKRRPPEWALPESGPLTPVPLRTARARSVARTADRTGAGAAPVRTVRRDRPLADLENDLADARRTLLTTIEDLECANEELVSIVEELQSSNEELHGANEELESTKEELQAANEELVGVNDELQSRIAELRVASDDVQNLLDLSPSAIVLVGMDGRLRRFNEAARQLFGIGHAQLGLPLDRLTKPLGAQQVDRIVGEVIDKLVPFDDRVAGPDGRPYAVRVIPYKTSERAIRGALISVSVAPTRAAEGLRPEVP